MKICLLVWMLMRGRMYDHPSLMYNRPGFWLLRIWLILTVSWKQLTWFGHCNYRTNNHFKSYNHETLWAHHWRQKHTKPHFCHWHGFHQSLLACSWCLFFGRSALPTMGINWRTNPHDNPTSWNTAYPFHVGYSCYDINFFKCHITSWCEYSSMTRCITLLEGHWTCINL